MSARKVVLIGILGGAGYLVYEAMRGNTGVLPPLSIDTSTAGGDVVSIEDYLQNRGLTFEQARGVAAGINAESLSNPNAVNPTSGAYGIGQWLGARKTALFAQYGSSPTLQQQLDFLVSELYGGDRGGPAVLSQSNPLDILTAYITKFMRPAPGIQTTSDIARGKLYLG